MAIKEKFQSNVETWIDEEYGYKIIKPLDVGSNRTLYFTSNPFLEDGEHIIVSSLREGSDQLYKLNFHTGEYIQLTDIQDLHPTISYIDRKRNKMYCRSKKQIIEVDLNTCENRVFMELDDDRNFLPSVAITCDSKYVITGYPEVYKVPNADGEIQTINITRVIKIDTETLEKTDILHTSYRIDHIQCSSTDPNYFIYCGWGYYPTNQRIWGARVDWRGGGPLGNEAQNQKRTHEYFTGDSTKIAYHGTVYDHIIDIGRYKPDYRIFGLMNADGSNDQVYRCPKGYKPGHSSMSYDRSVIIADGNDKISLLFLNGATMKCEVTPIFTHNSSMNCNFVHPHPSVSTDGRYVCFATDFGKGQEHTNFYIIDLHSKKN